MTLFGERDGAVRPALQIAMPHSPRIYAILKRNHPSGRTRGIIPVPDQIGKVGKEEVLGTASPLYSQRKVHAC